MRINEKSSEDSKPISIGMSVIQANAQKKMGGRELTTGELGMIKTVLESEGRIRAGGSDKRNRTLKFKKRNVRRTYRNQKNRRSNTLRKPTFSY